MKAMAVDDADSKANGVRIELARLRKAGERARAISIPARRAKIRREHAC